MELVLNYGSSGESDNENANPSDADINISNNLHQCLSVANDSEAKETKPDYFGLEESDSEDESMSSLLYQNATKLCDKSFGPDLRTIAVASVVSTSQATVACEGKCLQEKMEISDRFLPSPNTDGRSLKRHLQDDTYTKLRKTTCQNDSIEQRRFEEDVHIENKSETKTKSTKCSLFNVSTDSSETVKRKNSLFEHHEKVLGYVNKTNSSKPPQGKFKTFDGHDSCVTSLKWDIKQYSHLFLSASLDCNLKVWDYFHGQCMKEVRYNSGIRAAVWSLCGTKVISGGYGKQVHVTDITSGLDIFTQSHSDYVSSVQIHPEMHHIILSGTKHYVAAWDVRDNSAVPMRTFESRCGQVLDMIFNQEGGELIHSSEIASRDSADRTIMVWDFSTGALLSNQVFQERYTCPCIKLQPGGKNFIAQTNGSYIAVFSTSRPYKLNKKKRYEGHKVAGYGVECDFSPDGNYIVSGDAEGRLFFYKTHNAQIAKSFIVKSGLPTIRVAWHPLFYSTVAVGTWAGDVYMWQ